jgi:hypothetical protein
MGLSRPVMGLLYLYLLYTSATQVIPWVQRQQLAWCILFSFFNKTICPNVEIIKNFKIILRTVFEKTTYSHCLSICMTQRCSLTSTVVVLFTEIGGVTLYLEQLSHGRKLVQNSYNASYTLQEAYMQIYRCYKNNVDGKIQRKVWKIKHGFEIFNRQILSYVTFSVLIKWPIFVISFQVFIYSTWINLDLFYHKVSSKAFIRHFCSKICLKWKLSFQYHSPSSILQGYFVQELVVRRTVLLKL